MASRFWVGTTSTAWNVSGNWAATSGGAGGAGVPTNADDVTLDLNSNTNNCVVNVTAQVCKSITITSGFTRQLTMTNALTVSGSLTFSSTGTWTFGGTGSFILNASATITTGGRTLPGGLTIQAVSGTITLADTCNMSGTFTISTTLTTLSFSGAFDINASAVTISSASTTITFSGNVNCTTGLLTAGGGNQILNGAFTFNCQSFTQISNNPLNGTMSLVVNGGTFLNNTTSGILGLSSLSLTSTTISSTNPMRVGNGIIVTSVSGNINTGATLAIHGNCTLSMNGLSWELVTVSASATITLSNNLTITTTFTIAASVTITGSTMTIVSIICTTAGVAISFPSASNVNVSSNLTFTGTLASPLTFTGNLFLVNGATQDVSFVNATNANSAATNCQTIWDYKGVLSNATNWRVLTIPTTVVYASC